MYYYEVSTEDQPFNRAKIFPSANFFANRLVSNSNQFSTLYQNTIDNHPYKFKIGVDNRLLLSKKYIMKDGLIENKDHQSQIFDEAHNRIVKDNTSYYEPLFYDIFEK